MFEPWQLGMIDEAGYNGINDGHIEKVAESLLSTATAMKIRRRRRKTQTLHCWFPSIFPSRSKTAMATVNPLHG